MKTTIKLFLIVSMFCATALADGNQGAGGFKCEPDQENCEPPCTGVCGDFNTPAPGDGEISVEIARIIAEQIFRIRF